MGEGAINFFFYLTYILIGLALLGLVAGVVVSVVQNFKDGGIAAVAGLVGILILFGIGYALSSSEIPQALLDKDISGLESIRKVGAGMITFYALAAIATVLIVVDIVKGIVEGF